MKLTYHDIWLISNRICDAYDIGRPDESTQEELQEPQALRLVYVNDFAMHSKAA